MLEGVTVGAAGKPEKANLGNVTLDNITEANGGYKIGTLSLPDYSTTEEGMTVAIAGVSITGLTAARRRLRPIRWRR